MQPTLWSLPCDMYAPVVLGPCITLLVYCLMAARVLG